MYEKILEGIIAYWEKEIDDDEVVVAPESNLMSDLALSSLEMLRSLLVLETEFGIRIPEKQLRRMITVADTAQVILEAIEKQKGSK